MHSASLYCSILRQIQSNIALVTVHDQLLPSVTIYINGTSVKIPRSLQTNKLLVSKYFILSLGIYFEYVKLGYYITSPVTVLSQFETSRLHVCNILFGHVVYELRF